MPSRPGEQLWGDGYNGQRAVVLEELYSQVPLNELKSLCDKYDMQARVKGSFVPWSPDRIYITSQVHPDKCWPDDPSVSPADRAAWAGASHALPWFVFCSNT